MVPSTLREELLGHVKDFGIFPVARCSSVKPLLHAVRRIALRELSIDVQHARDCGYIEYPSHYMNGLDSPVGLVFEVTECSGGPAPNAEASCGAWFTSIPKDMHPDQDQFLINKGYLAIKS